MKDKGQVEEAIECYRKALELDPDYAGARGNLIYTLLFHPDYDMPKLYEETVQWDVHHGRRDAVFPAHVNERAPGRRLRIGYVSADFRGHVIGLNMLPLLERHDRSAVEIYCYSSAEKGDAMTERFRQEADVWRDICELNDEKAAELIRADRIDILVDLALHLAGNRLGIFTLKPAPVQMTFAGYPGTTGLHAIDYRLTDPYLDPPGATPGTGLFDAYYAEKSLRLRDSFWCFHPLTQEPPVAPLPVQERGYITFGNLNNLCKNNDYTLGLWAQVMHAVPRSRVTILSTLGTHRDRMVRTLEQAGIGAERVSFVLPRPRAKYLELYHDIDIGLDSFPYNGHSTSLDSCWMGVPVVTYVGPTVAGRAGWSQLSNLKLTELAGRTPEEFVKIAADLADNLEQLAWIRATLRQRMMDSPLMDATGFAQSIEGAYRQAWEKWCAKTSGI